MAIDRIASGGRPGGAVNAYSGDDLDRAWDWDKGSWLDWALPLAVGGMFLGPAAFGAGGAGGAAGTGASMAAGTGGASATSAIPWGPLFNAGASIYGTHAQTSSADRAAALQAAAAAQALAFEKQQAENAYLNNETARKANYGQWAARERRLGSIAESLGYGSREVPDYVPGVDPNFAGASNAANPNLTSPALPTSPGGSTGAPSGPTGTYANGAYTPPPALPTYAALTGSDGLTPRQLPSVGAALDPTTGQPAIAPGTLRMPSPYQWGAVGSYF